MAYDRLLERLYLVDEGWIIKGATALLARDIRHARPADLGTLVRGRNLVRTIAAGSLLDLSPGGAPDAPVRWRPVTAADLLARTAHHPGARCRSARQRRCRPAMPVATSCPGSRVGLPGAVCGPAVACSVSPDQIMPSCRARRVRSARRRQPLLSRIRSRWERTVLMLMNSWPAIWASVWPRATRVTSSRSRELSVPGAGSHVPRGPPCGRGVIPPVDARAFAAVHDFGPDERLRARQHPACFHRVPPYTAGPPYICLHPG
jgi:hypothetical protein